MEVGRREVIAGMVTIAAFGTSAKGKEKYGMYGLIGKMTAVAGKRDELIAILLDGVSEMPGCLSYVVAKDPQAADAIWITEVWADEASHKASLQSPTVKAAIAKGKPMIAGFGDHHATEPVGGHGLAV